MHACVYILCDCVINLYSQNTFMHLNTRVTACGSQCVYMHLYMSVCVCVSTYMCVRLSVHVCERTCVYKYRPI